MKIKAFDKILLVAVACFLLYAYIKPNLPMEVVRVKIDEEVERSVESFDDLIKQSKVIVKATVTEAEEYVSEFYSGPVLTGLNIVEVYKGDYAAGDKIMITEPYYFNPNTPNNKKLLSYYSNYAPSEKGKEYIFFLNDDILYPRWDELYLSVVDYENGRFPVIDSAYASKKLDGSLSLIMDKTGSRLVIDKMEYTELGMAEDSRNNELYKELYANVMAKYIFK